MKPILRLAMLLWMLPALAAVPTLPHLVAPLSSAVVSRDIVIYQGQAYTSLLTADGLATSGRGLRAHIRATTPSVTVVQILTHNGAANARVAFVSGGVQMTIGAAVSAPWVVAGDRVDWVYDVESYSLTDDDDVIVTHRGKVTVWANRTRESDITPSAQMPSGDGRYVRFDTDAQGLSDAQKLAARTNIGAGTGSGGGGSGDVVGPASATDDRIAAFDSTTGKLIKQGSVTATAVASHLSNTSNPHSVTAAQAGADPAGTADGAVSTHNGVTTAHGISAYGATLVNDADAATARSTLGLGSASVESAASFAATSHAHAAADTTSGTFDPARLPAATETAQGAVELATTSEATTGTDTTRAVTAAGVKAVADTKQAILVSGTNIKTVNSTSLLGSGDIAISASPAGSGTELQYRNGSAFGAMSGTAWDDTNRAETRTGATVTTSNPVQSFTQTWNAGAVTFSGWKINITNTASAAASLVADWQVNGTSLLNLRSDGRLYVKSILIDGGGAGTAALDVGGLGNALRTATLNITNSIYFGNGYGTLSSGNNAGLSITHWAESTGGIILSPGASNYVEQRRGTNAQTSRVYGTYTDSSNYVRASLAATSTAVTLAAETAGTGADDIDLTVSGAGTGKAILTRGKLNGVATALATKTTSYTLTVTDATILSDATSGALTMTLPACSTVSGSRYVIKKIDSSGNAVTIDGNASETIDGATTLALATQWKYAQIQCDGSSWYVIGSN